MLLPPCFFLGFDYLIFGRLVRESGVGHYLKVFVVLALCCWILLRSRLTFPSSLSLVASNENKVSKIFLTSDIVTFLMQMGGGSMSAIESMRKIGTYLTLVGVIAQAISFVAFM